MDPRGLILRKRRGEELTAAEIDEIVLAYARDEVPDYQMSALMMAIVWQGMSEEETFALTRAMVRSGRTLSYPDLAPTADKHSTGGVGDKVSLALAPLAASAGLHVPMLSGRGLGHTGGTLDKLESIPGFTTRLDADRFSRILRDVGCVMGGQSTELAPADGKIYALRDATATIESYPLIVSSILSKKVAAGPDVLVLDVKVGRGAFMKDLETARELAGRLVRTGTRFGRTVVAFLTNMDRPLGRAVGNAIEVGEAAALLRGDAVEPELREVTLVLTAAMLVAAGRAPSLAAARETLESMIRGGDAYRRFRRLVEAQGGRFDAIERGTLPRAPRRIPVPSVADGSVVDIDPLEVAEIVVELGGGRREMSDGIDPAVGAWLDRRPGEAVLRGETLLTLHVPERMVGREEELIGRARSACRVGAAAAATPLIHAVVGAAGEVAWSGWETRLPT